MRVGFLLALLTVVKASSPLLPGWKPPTSVDLAVAKGYPVEKHVVETEDGYYLEIFRLPRGRTSLDNSTPRPPLLLQHGLLCSSDVWLIGNPEKALGYVLADQGFDVWIGNNRGSPYGRRHKTLDPKGDAFWDFSFHEMGYYDLPAMIDRMLNVTGFRQIAYVGHSQGTSQFFALMSSRPEYNAKVKIASALAPVANLNHLRGLGKFLLGYFPQLQWLVRHGGVKHFLDRSYAEELFGHLFCSPHSIFRKTCDSVFFIIVGFDSPQLNKTLVETITEHAPDGVSTKQLIHFGQIAQNKGRFAQFDYGRDGNLRKYGSPSPPVYDTSNIKVPVLLHYSENDYMAAPQDVERLAGQLKQAALMKVPYKMFNHLDYMWGINARELIYDVDVQIIHSFFSPRLPRA